MKFAKLLGRFKLLMQKRFVYTRKKTIFASKVVFPSQSQTQLKAIWKRPSNHTLQTKYKIRKNVKKGNKQNTALYFYRKYHGVANHCCFIGCSIALVLIISNSFLLMEYIYSKIKRLASEAEPFESIALLVMYYP